MRFFLEIRAAPNSSGAVSARHFASAVSASDHQLWKVFFFAEGAAHAAVTGKGEEPAAFWQQCAEKTGAELLVCASAWQRLREKEDTRLHPGFDISGLAELVCVQPDAVRLISFNP